MTTTTTTGATVTESQAYEAIRLAQLHEGKGAMVSSARVCLEDALDLFQKGAFGYARARARKSLAYSVGILHPDYAKAGAV